MNKENEKLQKEFFQLLGSQDFIESELDYSKLDVHIRTFNDNVYWRNSAVSVFDCFKRKQVYFSKGFENIFSYAKSELENENMTYLYSKIHPDDYHRSLELGFRYFKFMMNLPYDMRMNYKTISDYRMMDGKGKYLRVIKQHQLLEQDSRANLWLSMSAINISPDQDLNSSYRSYLMDTVTGQIFDFRSKELDQILTDRELQIIRLISKGYGSKQIAHELCISFHTVNTHRQRILKKLKVKNTFEAIQYLRTNHS